MILQRARNTKRNVFVGMLAKLITIILPFITQTIFIRIMGNEYNGLKGVFSSILQVLCVAELGIGSAMVFSMYKPISEEDDDKICALLNLYKKIYRIIGLVIFISGALVTPFLKFLIKDAECPDGINIYLIFIIYLLNTVLSYWMFAYKGSILSAFQRQDILSFISIVSFVVVNGLQIWILLSFRNFYFYTIASIIGTILNNLLISIIVDKKFPQYKCKGQVSAEQIKSIKKKVFGLGISRLCYITRNGFDSIFLSAFLGLEIAGIYNLYYNYIFLNVINLLGILTTSMLAGIGNSVAAETIDKNYSDFQKLDFIYMIIAGTCAICLYSLYQPFMKVWVGEDSMFSQGVVILLCVYFYISCMGSVRSLYSDAAGLWWENRGRVIGEMVCNIILNFVLGKHFGVHGIIIATCISLFVFGFIGSAIVLFKKYFREGLKVYFINQAIYALCTFTVCVVIQIICNFITIKNSWAVLGIRIVACIVAIPLLYYIIYHNSSIFKKSKIWFIDRIKYQKIINTSHTY